MILITRYFSASGFSLNKLIMAYSAKFNFNR